MATIWLTYAWEDNQTGDVDFAAQELVSAGLGVKLDRWNIEAGKHLWLQIEKFIQDPTSCDAWVLYATQTSLGSPACQEEYLYALDRALKTRGKSFPVIGLFPGPVDTALIPAGIKTRLYVSLTDPDWKERIKAAAEGRTPSIAQPTVEPYEIQVHTKPTEDSANYYIEVRPRAGTWAPIMAAVPLSERSSVNPRLVCGPRGRPINPAPFIMFSSGEEESKDG